MNQPPESVSSPEPQSQPPAPVSSIRKVFFNDCELRAGWRLLIFFAVLMATPDRAFFIHDSDLRWRHWRHTNSAEQRPQNPAARNRLGPLSPEGFIGSDGLSFAVLLGLTGLAALIERRPMRDYGLPLRQAFRGNFWLGCLWGFAAISVLLLVLHASHGFYYGPPAIRGWNALRFAGLWAMAFLSVGLFEEFLLRGYAQFTLTLGIGFWPAAFLLSLCFAFLHRTNPGETAAGLFEIVLIALFFCFTLWRTGNLWFAVGFHAAWDWSQSFFYGTPDSGLLVQGRLLRGSFAGPAWLSGGSAGPEGSVLVAPLIGLLFVLFYLAYPRRAPYPDPEAVRPADPELVLPKLF